MLTIWMLSVNTAGQMEKRFTGGFAGIERVVSNVEGLSAHRTRGGKTTPVRTVRLLYAMALVIPLTPTLPASPPAAWSPLSTATL
jgi:hypothetical protein